MINQFRRTVAAGHLQRLQVQQQVGRLVRGHLFQHVGHLLVGHFLHQAGLEVGFHFLQHVRGGFHVQGIEEAHDVVDRHVLDHVRGHLLERREQVPLGEDLVKLQRSEDIGMLAVEVFLGLVGLAVAVPQHRHRRHRVLILAGPDESAVGPGEP